MEAQLKAVEVAHERLQNKNSEDSKRFADGQGRAAEQLANLQEALTEEMDNGKQNKTLLYDAMEKERNFLEKIDFQSVDIWFPLLHGLNGEDGAIHGLLKFTQKPLIGCGILGSALGMDKILMKKMFSYHEILLKIHLIDLLI